MGGEGTKELLREKERKKQMSIAMESKAFPMNGGKGDNSYSKNSKFQRQASDVVKQMIEEAIFEKLDVKSLSAESNIIRVADLGCSVGPNTIFSMENIIQAINYKLNSQDPVSETPEFLILFNDHVSNDFNTLFVSLPANKNYFPAGVPGSFYGRLFPESCLHFVHSAFALQWMSKPPEKLNYENSSFWNNRKIFYSGASDEVAKAYSEQFSRDIMVFLEARAKEIVSGGLMVIIVPACPDGIRHSDLSTKVLTGLFFDIIEKGLIEMVKAGSISEDQVNSFNFPFYIVSPNEMKKLIEKNGKFSIETMELSNPRLDINGPVNVSALISHLRAGFEVILSKHFGKKAVDELFKRILNKSKELSAGLELVDNKGTQLLLVLKRK